MRLSCYYTYTMVVCQDIIGVKGMYLNGNYFAGSVGGSTLEIVKQYIQQQDTPH